MIEQSLSLYQIEKVEKISSKSSSGKRTGIDPTRLINEGVSSGSAEDNEKMIAQLTIEMTNAAKNLEFEKAAEIRDIIIELKGKK